MRSLLSWLWVCGLPLSGAENSISDQQIREEANRLAVSAAKESPMMAIDTLLRTAMLIRPYVKQDSDRIYRRAVEHAAKNPDLTMSYQGAALWMDLDPSGGEATLRKLTNRRRVLQALSAYYMRKNPERSVDLAVEALQLDPERKSETPGLMETVAASRPLLTLELLQLPHIVRDPQYPFTFAHALEGLQRAALTKPADVKQAADRLEPLVRREDFAASATMIVSLWKHGQERPKASDSRPALLEMLDQARRMTDEKTRAAAQAAARSQSTNFETKTGGRPPVDGTLPLDRAIEAIRKLEPAYQGLGELWRYLQGRQRSVDEDRAILAVMVEWSQSVTRRSDPAWFLQSLLNLDGRLGGPSSTWKLAPALRPMVFVAAARAGERMDDAPEQLTELSLAMAAERVPVPEDLAVVRNRMALDQLRAKLEGRYNFSLSGMDQTKTSLQDLRGKAVVLNFWATWCGPCRAEFLVLERLSKEFGKDLEVLAITEETREKVAGFLEKNPTALRLLLDAPREVVSHYIKPTTGVPQSSVIGKDGLIVKHFRGEAKEDEMRAAIRSALSN